MFFMQKTIVAVTCAALMAGCAHTSKPMEIDAKYPSTAAKSADYAENTWESRPAVIKEGKPMIVLGTPFKVPAEVAKKSVKMELEPGATVGDVVAILGNLGHSIILADREAGDKDFFMPRYSGNLGNLLNAISRAADVWFTYEDGVINVSSKESILLSVPQEEIMAEKLAEGLGKLAGDSNVQWEAGMVALSLKPSEFRRVRTYLERMTKNSALVTMQMAIVNVTMNQDRNTGIDWGALELAIGGGSVLPSQRSLSNATTAPTNPVVPGAPGTNTTNVLAGTDLNGDGIINQLDTALLQQNNGNVVGGVGTVVGGAVGGLLNAVGGIATAQKLSKGVSIQDGGLRGTIMTRGFSMSGLVNFLQTYGTTETKQNVLLSTVTGNEVELNSLQQIPYIGNIGSSTLTAGTNLNNTSNVRTEKANDGLTVKMKPSYDAASNTVTVELDLKIEAVIGFNKLSAGNNLGSFEQPTTAERSFNDVLRVRPGQTVVVGGLSYDSVAKNNNGPVFLQGSKWEGESYKVTRQTMFIVMKPTVTTYGAMIEQEGLELLQEANVPVEEEAPIKERINRGKSSAKDSTEGNLDEKSTRKSQQAKPEYNDVTRAPKEAEYVEFK